MRQPDTDVNDDLQPEYDFSEAIQGQHHRGYEEGATVVIVDRNATDEVP